MRLRGEHRKATSGIPKTAARELGAAVEKFAAGRGDGIEQSTAIRVVANRQIKTLVYIADDKPILILIRGDDQLNETKFLRGLVRGARPATPGMFPAG